MNVQHDDFVWEGQFVRSGLVDKITDELQAIGYARYGNPKSDAAPDVLYLDLSSLINSKKGYGLSLPILTPIFIYYIIINFATTIKFYFTSVIAKNII